MNTSARRSRYSGLLALNGVALAALVAVSLAPGAAAQNQPRTGGGSGGASARGRGDYTMVSAKIQGSLENAVFVIDSNNSEMLAIKWDGGRRAIVGLGHRDLAADAKKPGAKGR